MNGLDKVRRAVAVARGDPWCEQHLCDSYECRTRHPHAGSDCPQCGEPMYAGAGPDGLCKNGHDWWDE